MQAASNTRLAVVAVVLVAIWGTTWAAIRISLEGFPPLTGLAMRFALATVILALVARFQGVRHAPNPQRWGVWLCQALLAFCLAFGLVYWGEQWVPSGLMSVLFSTMPLFVVLLAYVSLPNERLGWLGLLGMVIGFGGVAVIFSDDLTALGGPMVRRAAPLMLIPPFASAIVQVVVKRWGQEMHNLSLAVMPLGIATLLLAPTSWWLEGHLPWHWEPRPILAVLYLAIFGTSVTFGLYYWLLQRASATVTSLITYCTPVVAVALGTTLFDEPLTWRIVLGSLLVLSGVALVIRPRPDAQKSSPATETSADGA